mmetsp:Transcript_56851/g.126775  ORF Transcript_56851/g.126775 Transcript_56851/m.126775 type:complete len:140 (-) Transcript_56851:189-608(-)
MTMRVCNTSPDLDALMPRLSGASARLKRSLRVRSHSSNALGENLRQAARRGRCGASSDPQPRKMTARELLKLVGCTPGRAPPSDELEDRSNPHQPQSASGQCDGHQNEIKHEAMQAPVASPPANERCESRVVRRYIVSM